MHHFLFLFTHIRFTATESSIHSKTLGCPVGWGCKMHRRHLCRGVRPLPNECPGYDTK